MHMDELAFAGEVLIKMLRLALIAGLVVAGVLIAGGFVAANYL